jgi:hypothetical protein
MPLAPLLLLQTDIPGGDEILFVSPDKIDTDTWANYKSGTLSEDNNNYYIMMII